MKYLQILILLFVFGSGFQWGMPLLSAKQAQLSEAQQKINLANSYFWQGQELRKKMMKQVQ